MILQADPRVRSAALVARLFRQDPYPFLDDDGDDWPMLIRLACARVVEETERKAAEANERASQRRR